MPTPWRTAVLVASLCAVDPHAIGGVVLRAAAGPVRARWLAGLRALLPAGTPWCRLPLDVPDARLLGGIDLAATLAAGRPVVERGLLAAADGGMVEVAMAERVERGAAARIAAALDAGSLCVERAGCSLRAPARFGAVLLDEGLGEEERAPAALVERLAFEIELDGLRLADCEGPFDGAARVAAARARVARVESGEEALAALCGIALGFGIRSLRAPLLALRVARAAAALAGRERLDEEDLKLAAALAFAHRALALPSPPAQEDETISGEEAAPPPAERGEASAQAPANEPPAQEERPLEDRVLDAVQAALDPRLLASLTGERGARAPRGGAGRAGEWQTGGGRGRPLGVRSGLPRRGERLDLVATLYAAAPWQALRRREAAAASGPLLQVRRDDLRTRRYRQRRRTMTLFVVDASGSSALHRLAEAKGAVELLLAQCYARRDEVALLAFRGPAAELLLPPTRSLVRAKRSLAGLPGGGGTPLAAAIDAAAALALNARRGGSTPLVVFFTDGRGNLARDGTQGRAAGEADALRAAGAYAAATLQTLLVDTAPRPAPQTGRLADALGARYLALPHADAARLAGAVIVERTSLASG